MHRLLDYLHNNDLFLSFRPAKDGSVVFTFRKTNNLGQVSGKFYKMTKVEIDNVVDMQDVLLDFAERFMNEFNANEDKKW